MPESWIGLLVLGIGAGIASGMFGIGGGVVIVPILISLFGFTLTQATGTSLAALLMPVGIFAVLAYHRAGKLQLMSAAPIALGLFLTSYVGAALAVGLDTAVLQRLYGVFLLYAAWRFAEPRQWWRKGQQRRAARSATPPDEAMAAASPTAGSTAAALTPTPRDAEAGSPLTPPPAFGSSGRGVGGEGTWLASLLPLLAIGLLAGVLSGMFGIGGGLVIVPVLVALLRFDQKEAVGTSLAALLLPVSLPGVWRYYQEGLLNIPIAILIAVGLAGGAIIGARIALALPSTTVKRLYAGFLLVIAIRFLFPQLFIPA